MRATLSTPVSVKFLRLLAALSIIVSLGFVSANATTNSVTVEQLNPSAALNPQEVVRIQLQALRANDSADHGIEICFRFASPTNQASTGPVARFGQMIKDGIYSLMLNYEEAQYQNVEIVDRYARQKVTLVGTSKIVTFVFYLSKQTHSQCEECWMTDSVAIEEILEST
jgi:hypothetical protein